MIQKIRKETMRGAYFIRICLMLCMLPSLLYAQRDSICIDGKIALDPALPVKKVSVGFEDVNGQSHHYEGTLQNGYFRINVPSQERPVAASFLFDRKPLPFEPPLTLFLEQEDIHIAGPSGDLRLLDVSGGQNNIIYSTLQSKKRTHIVRVNEIYRSLYGDLSSGRSDAEKKTLASEWAKMSQDDAAMDKLVIQQYPNLYLSYFLLYQLSMYYTADHYAKAYKSLDPAYRSSIYGRHMQETIDKDGATPKGGTFPNFTRTTNAGSSFGLSELRGNIVLLDFWGSWCGPCRASMPHLKDLYERYKDKGFKIVGIAHERGKTAQINQESWSKAIIELELPWINVLNNEANVNDNIVESSRIYAFPTKILLDREGKVLMRISAAATTDVEDLLKEIYGY